MAAQDDEGGGLPAISLRESRLSDDRQARPWSFRLFVFLRVMAAIELVRALVTWGALLGVGGGADPLDATPRDALIATVVFAVADPVAAVGLWIGAAWGVAIWLLAMLAHLLTVGLVGAPSAPSLALGGFELAAMLAYLVLSLKARRETD
jgi:hypothetical protein